MNTKHHLTLLIFFILSTFTSLAYATSYNKVVIFGDSLSDTGNLASISAPFPFPYYNNRVTNGPVAVDVLTSLLNKNAAASLYLLGQAQGTNYAVAGASATGNRPIDFQNQVGAFLLANAGQAATDNLYIIFIGGNDVRSARDTDRRSSLETVKQAVHMIKIQVERLYSAGARSFLVVNVPNIGEIPETIKLAQQTGKKHVKLQATLVSVLFNFQLDQKMNHFRNTSDASLVVFDLFTFASHFSNHPKAFSLINIDTACFSSVTYTFDPTCEFGQRFKNYFYFDEIHPSSTLHDRLGKGMFALLPQRD